MYIGFSRHNEKIYLYIIHVVWWPMAQLLKRHNDVDANNYKSPYGLQHEQNSNHTVSYDKMPWNDKFNTIQIRKLNDLIYVKN